MYPCINGWTKERMKAQIRAGNNGTKAADLRGQCRYLTEDGNRCAVGCFIPDGHPGQRHEGTAVGLLYAYPDLRDRMPLDAAGLKDMQLHAHDLLCDPVVDVRDHLCAWIDENVADPA